MNNVTAFLKWIMLARKMSFWLTVVKFTQRDRKN